MVNGGCIANFFCCVRLFLHCSSGGCGCFLMKVVMAVVMMVLVVGTVVFFGSGRLVAMLKVVDLVMVELPYHGLCSEGLGGSSLLVSVSIL